MLASTYTNLTHFKELLAQAGADPEVQAKLDQSIELFQSAVTDITKGGGKPQPAGPAAAAPGPRKAIPAAPQQMPMSGGRGAVPVM